MTTPNPFLNRGSLAGLIARRNQVNSTMEGASPFNAFMARRRGRQIDEAINQFAPRPMQRPQQMARPQPMAQAAMPAAAAPMSPTGIGRVLPAPGGTGATVTVTGGQPMPQAPMPQMPAQGGGWNALGLGGFGGFDPRMLMQQRGIGYGGYGQGFGGFGAQQPYRPALPPGGFAGLF